MTATSSSATTVTDPTKVWNEFWAWIRCRPSEQFLFRGQGKGYPIVPKVGRKQYPYSLASEKDILSKFKKTAPSFLKGRDPQSDWEWLALAQHHGAPTRLTDWSENPLVALYFAVSDCDQSSDAYLYALDLYNEDIEKVDPTTGKTGDGTTIEDPLELKKRCYLVETASVSARIIPQRGVFTIHGDPQEPLGIPDADTFLIPGSLKKEMVAQLTQLGVEALDIFPDIDGLCKSLETRYANGIALGALI